MVCLSVWWRRRAAFSVQPLTRFSLNPDPLPLLHHFSTGPLIRNRPQQRSKTITGIIMRSGAVVPSLLKQIMGGPVLFLPFLPSWQVIEITRRVRRNARSIARWE